jgi:predicted CopG family antitoxin
MGAMRKTIEIDGDLYDRLEGHCEEGESIEELIEELVSMYEPEGTLMQEGYSE